MSTWVLVAHRSGARVFVREGRQLRLVQSIDHPAGRLNDHEHEPDILSFVQELAQLLEKGRVSRGVKRIILVAEPHFLGLLRAKLGTEVQALVTGSVSKDLCAVKGFDILSRLEGALRGSRKTKPQRLRPAKILEAFVNHDGRTRYSTRHSVLKLLSDAEFAGVSSADTVARLEEDDEYLDLEQLDRGVRRASKDITPMGRVLPRKAVQEETWTEILRELAGPGMARPHSGGLWDDAF